MLGDTKALKKLSANAHVDALGKRDDAGSSFTKQSRKSEVGAPFPKFDRIDYRGKTAVFVNDGRGWIICVEEGQFQNPWKNRPFRELAHAKNAIKSRFKYGWWPGKHLRRKPNAGRIEPVIPDNQITESVT